MSKKLTEAEIEEQVDALTSTFINVANALLDMDVVNYPYIRKHNKTGVMQKVSIRIHVEDLTDEEFQDYIKEGARKVE